MKKITPVLVMVFVFVFSAGVLASDFEFVGGGLYTTLEFTELNEGIDALNDEIDGMVNYFEEEPSVEVDVKKLENIKSAFGFFGGVRYGLSSNTKIGADLERFSPGTAASINVSDEIGNSMDMSIDINVTVNGLVAVFENKFGEYIKLNAGAGYYSGNIESNVSSTGSPVGPASIQQIEDEYEESATSTLNGMGYKVGAGFVYDMEDNEDTSLFADLNYRILKLNVENQDMNEEFYGDTLNADGIELRAGICYKF